MPRPLSLRAWNRGLAQWFGMAGVAFDASRLRFVQHMAAPLRMQHALCD